MTAVEIDKSYDVDAYLLSCFVKQIHMNLCTVQDTWIIFICTQLNRTGAIAGAAIGSTHWTGISVAKC